MGHCENWSRMDTGPKNIGKCFLFKSFLLFSNTGLEQIEICQYPKFGYNSVSFCLLGSEEKGVS